jgi:hypothetical protein
MPKYIVTFLSRVDVEIEAKTKEDAPALAQAAWNKDPRKYIPTTTNEVLIRRSRQNSVLREGVN